MYEGRLTADERRATYTRTLTKVAAMLSQPDAGVWRERKAMARAA
jgi:hypothetical protein